jgi:hypothetical protein
MGLYNWRNKLLLDLPMLMRDHDPVNTLSVNRGRAGTTLNGVFGAAPAAPTKLGYRRGYSFDGGDLMFCLNTVAVPLGAPLGTLNFPLTLGFFAKCDADFSGDGLLWRAQHTVLEMRNEAAAGTRVVPFNIGFDQDTISLGRGGVKNLATYTPLAIGQIYAVVGTFDSTNYNIYINGEQYGSGAHAGGDQSVDSQVAAANLSVGCRTTDGGAPANLFTGELYHAFLADFALSPHQAAQYSNLMWRRLHQL